MFSLIISCPNCTGNVNSLIEAVGFSSLVPNEVIIVSRRNFDFKTDDYSFKIKVVKPKEEEALSASTVRNLGATEATNSILMFLQKGYQPSSDYFREQIDFFQRNEGILMGLSNNDLFPHHPDGKFSRLEKMEHFNGRNFVIKAADYKKIGGFDQSYFGQGVEDIDFAYVAKQKNIPIYVHHQTIEYSNTEIYKLPLNQFLPIIDNCDIFKQKWGLYPMKDCLTSFKNENLIDWNGQDNGEINIIKFPSFEMIENVKVNAESNVPA